MSTDNAPTSVFSPSRALFIAALLLASAAVLKLLSPDHISVELAHRLLGVLLGMLVVVYANAVPKVLLPLLQLRDDSVADQARRRFVGIALVIGGLAYGSAWLLAPLATAPMIAGGLLGSALLLVFVRIGWDMRKASRSGAA